MSLNSIRLAASVVVLALITIFVVATTGGVAAACRVLPAGSARSGFSRGHSGAHSGGRRGLHQGGAAASRPGARRSWRADWHPAWHGGRGWQSEHPAWYSTEKVRGERTPDNAISTYMQYGEEPYYECDDDDEYCGLNA